MQAVVHFADVQDRDGGALLLSTLLGRFPYLEKLFADSAYQGPNLNFTARMFLRLASIRLMLRRLCNPA